MKAVRFFSVFLCAVLLFALAAPLSAEAASSAANWKRINAIWVEQDLIVGLRTDGTVVLDDQRDYKYNKLDVSGWTDIIDICVLGSGIVGLRSDGRVLATGDPQLVSTASSWNRVVQLCGTFFDFAALRADGSVYWLSGDSERWEDESPSFESPAALTNVARLIPGAYTIFGIDKNGKLLPRNCPIPKSDGVKDICYNSDVTMFLYSDGTACLYSAGSEDQRWMRAAAVSRWTDLKQISAGDWIYAGLRRDGTVVSCDLENVFHETDSWRDVTRIWTTSDGLVFGLRKDGRLYFSGAEVEKMLANRIRTWSNVRDLFVGPSYIAVLFSDGSVQTAALYGSADEPFRTSGWKNVRSLDGNWDHLVGLCADGSVLVAESED